MCNYAAHRFKSFPKNKLFYVFENSAIIYHILTFTMEESSCYFTVFVVSIIFTFVHAWNVAGK